MRIGENKKCVSSWAWNFNSVHFHHRGVSMYLEKSHMIAQNRTTCCITARQPSNEKNWTTNCFVVKGLIVFVIPVDASLNSNLVRLKNNGDTLHDCFLPVLLRTKHDFPTRTIPPSFSCVNSRRKLCSQKVVSERKSGNKNSPKL